MWSSVLSGDEWGRRATALGTMLRRGRYPPAGPPGWFPKQGLVTPVRDKNSVEMLARINPAPHGRHGMIGGALLGSLCPSPSLLIQEQERDRAQS